jgi:hypothetical protein
MKALCYRASLGTPWDDHCYNLMIQLGGWTTIGIDTLDYFVPENRSFLLVLSHPQLERRESHDYFL